jgi:hypothetical protein
MILASLDHRNLECIFYAAAAAVVAAVVGADEESVAPEEAGDVAPDEPLSDEPEEGEVGPDAPGENVAKLAPGGLLGNARVAPSTTSTWLLWEDDCELLLLDCSEEDFEELLLDDWELLDFELLDCELPFCELLD